MSRAGCCSRRRRMRLCCSCAWWNTICNATWRSVRGEGSTAAASVVECESLGEGGMMWWGERGGDGPAEGGARTGYGEGLGGGCRVAGVIAAAAAAPQEHVPVG